MIHRVRDHLRLEARAYDEAIRRFIPGYDRMLERVVREVAAVEPAVVVDLGAGTGALAEALLARAEVDSVVLLDVDPEMLAVASERLARFGERARFLEGSFYEPLPRCDAVTTSLALHHLPTLRERRRVHARVRGALGPRGVYVDADVMMAEEPTVRAAVMRRWADHLVAAGIDEDDAWRHFRTWAEEDTYYPVEAEAATLRAAGFHVRCAWRDEPTTVLVALPAV
jgi:tRNA (cmo5U34)-methyltransferase